MTSSPRRDLLAARISGVLLHPTSLPAPGPIGTLGPPAERFIDFLVEARQSAWQILPVGPTPGDGSPYRALSAFAGNTWMLAPEPLVAEGLLSEPDLPSSSGTERADFDAAAAQAERRAAEAFGRFGAGAGGQTLVSDFEAFREAHSHWLDDYALFIALKRRYSGRAWIDWPQELATRQDDALRGARESEAQAVAQIAFEQFLFDRQWHALKSYAEARGIALIGDIPIYVDLDSADAWLHQSLFEIDPSGRPQYVAGVPPDYFSKTGQRWGNPLYSWRVMAERGFDWWIERFRRTFELVDVVRIDHFRAFDQYWRIPAAEPTAVNGEWVDGPGAALFEAVERELGRLAVIAEDLGLITDSVKALRDQLGFPGMKILQFAFSGESDHPYLPENYIERCVVYPGTHDNDTSAGWYGKLAKAELEHVHAYLGAPPADPAWALIELAWKSKANLAIAAMQDLLSLGTEARMNTPAEEKGNWTWRLRDETVYASVAGRLSALTAEAERLSNSHR